MILSCQRNEGRKWAIFFSTERRSSNAEGTNGSRDKERTDEEDRRLRESEEERERNL